MAVAGESAIEAGETRWLFTPRDPWTAGDYDLVALAFLEDLAGNRIGRAFEVDNFERTDLTPEPEKRTLRFNIASVVISAPYVSIVSDRASSAHAVVETRCA